MNTYRTLIILLLLFPFLFMHADSFPLYFQHGAPTDGSAQTFSTNQLTGVSIEMNPALIVFSNGLIISASSQKFLEQYNHGHYSLTGKFSRWGIAAGYRYFDWGKIIRIDEFGVVFEKIWWYTTISSLGIAGNVTQNSSFGLTFNYLQDNLYWGNNNSVAIDIGFFIGKSDFPQYVGTIPSDLPSHIAINNLEGTEKYPLSVGLALRNIGPLNGTGENNEPILPQSFHLGIAYQPVNTQLVRLKIGMQIENDLICSFPDSDWDGDLKIGGYDKNGQQSAYGEYNQDGQMETAHAESWYKSLYLGWVEEWYFGGDIDKDGNQTIGGYKWSGEELINTTDVEPGEDGWGKYNAEGDLEVGSYNGSLRKQLEDFTYHYGCDLSITPYLTLKYGIEFRSSIKLRFSTIGISIGPRFIKYHFSQLTNKDNYYSWNSQDFHAIEVNILPLIRLIR